MLFRTLSPFLLLLAIASPATALPNLNYKKLDFAFRDATASSEQERRVVKLQGTRDGTFNFTTPCGQVGQNCECLLFRGGSDREPLRSAGSWISQQHNSFSCTIPGDQAMPDRITHVLVRLRGGAAVTLKEPIRTTLRLEDVIGPTLSKSKVRGIFKYSCARTFFEGEGVSESQIACVPGQRLGVISARYNFYIFRSGEDRNEMGGDTAFESPICGRNSFLKTQCTGNTPELRYGLYKDSVAPFVVGITLTRAPEGDNLSTNYGFAAVPDSSGACPPGLEKARPWLAQPASITEGSLDGMNPPSSFINANNSLNNTLVETTQPQNFLVTRQANAVPCDATGDCTGAEFAGSQQAQSVMYIALTPTVCVIPPSLLDGIF